MKAVNGSINAVLPEQKEHWSCTLQSKIPAVIHYSPALMQNCPCAGPCLHTGKVDLQRFNSTESHYWEFQGLRTTELWSVVYWLGVGYGQ